MKYKQTCCGPCEGLGFCENSDTNCCIECHMAWEEASAKPYLPPHLFAELQREHSRLERAQFNPTALAAHSVWEEEMFRRYCPPDVCAQILHDHKEWENGRLKSRNQALQSRLLR